MNKTLLSCAGGTVALPAADLVLVDAADGGNLIVHPPREVWERSELLPTELSLWSFLVAATGRAMLDTLPQLAGGCVNYWEAGNWSLNDMAEPRGPKRAPEHRRVHLHLLGRNRSARSPALRWGEAPLFPEFAARHAWARDHRRLGAAQCAAIVRRAALLLGRRYGLRADQIAPAGTCPECGYPTPLDPDRATLLCSECRA